MLPRRGGEGGLGTHVFVGKLTWLVERGVDVSGMQGEEMGAMEGLTCVAAAVDGRLVGIFGLTDPVKKSARALVAGVCLCVCAGSCVRVRVRVLVRVCA
jgi:cation transport ATPase